MYVNTVGRLLHHGSDDSSWVIGDKLDYRALRGSQARHSPASEDSWEYWTGSEWKQASVTVTGKGNPDMHVTKPTDVKTSAYGPGLSHGVCGEPANFTVSTEVNNDQAPLSNPRNLI